MTDITIKQIPTVFPVKAEPLTPDPKFNRRRSIIREFALNTSANGIPSIARSVSIANRIFWIVATLAFLGTMLFFVIESIIAYFNYPTQTSVSVIVAHSQPFPAVSICNYSPLRYDAFINDFLNYTNSRNLTNTTDNSTISPEQANYIRDFFEYILNSNYSSIIEKYLFPLNAMLISCVYNGQFCNDSDFITFLSSSYGQCYTFNAKIKTDQNSVRLTTDDGGYGLLQLQLYAYNYQYVPYVSEGNQILKFYLESCFFFYRCIFWYGGYDS
jgi:hypothetical protein